MIRVTATLAALLLAAPAVAEDETETMTESEFPQFVVSQAHERSFKGCDAAILDAFGTAGGQDIRVMTYSVPGTEKDSLRIHAVFGAPGDAVHQEAEFRKLGKKCVFTLTTTVVGTRSCTVELGENSAFKYQTETAGVVYTQNEGGVDLLLTPVGSGCMMTYFRSGEG